MSDGLERDVYDDAFVKELAESYFRPRGDARSRGPADTQETPAVDEKDALELVAHRDVRPAFLSTAPEGSFSRQIEMVLPVTSSSDILVKAAEKGSAALLDYIREERRAKIARDNTDISKSDMAKLVPGGEAASAAAAVASRPQNRSDRWRNDPTEVGGSDAADIMHLQKELEVLRKRIYELRRQEELRDEVQGGDAEGSSRKGRAPTSLSSDALRSLGLPRTEQSDAQREAMLRVRQSLPVYACREELLRYIDENPVTIVVGETGSGKTTQLVQYLLESGYARRGRMIGCTQPRRLAAIGVATRVAEEVGCTLGTTVGYSIHLDDVTLPGVTKLRFMTDGVLLREIIHDPDCMKYSVIMLDEAHERSVDTDILLGVLKDVCRRRSDLKVIVTSATMNTEQFSQFFDGAPIYEIPGKTFEVDLHYAAEAVDDYVHEAVLKVAQIHLKTTLEVEQQQQQQQQQAHATATFSNGGDILVFMTGRDDVYGTCALIHRQLETINKRRIRVATRNEVSGEVEERYEDVSWADSLMLLPVMSEASSVSSRQRQLLFNPAPPGMRKCVVATNVAETSLTIDGIRFVVDCGMMKTNVFHPKFGMNTLKRYPTSQAQSNQRKGRAGRTAKGVCYRLFTKRQFENEMLPTTVPEIQRTSIDTVVLLLKSIGVDDLSRFDFIDPPPELNIRSSLWQLWLLGALNGEDGKITNEGRQMLELPIAPSLATMVLHSSRLKCSEEMLSIVAMLSADPKGLFEVPSGGAPQGDQNGSKHHQGSSNHREEEARQAHGRFHNLESDHLTLLNVWQHYCRNERSRHWCRDHFLGSSMLERAALLREQLVDKAVRLRGFRLSSCGYETDVVRKCLVYGYALQAAQRTAGKWNEFMPLLTHGLVCQVHPASSILSTGTLPKLIVYDQLYLATKEYLTTVTAVQPAWLIEAGRGLYSVAGGAPVPVNSVTKSSFSLDHGDHDVVKPSSQARPSVSASSSTASALLDALLFPSMQSHSVNGGAPHSEGTAQRSSAASGYSSTPLAQPPPVSTTALLMTLVNQQEVDCDRNSEEVRATPPTAATPNVASSAAKMAAPRSATLGAKGPSPSMSTFGRRRPNL